MKWLALSLLFACSSSSSSQSQTTPPPTNTGEVAQPVEAPPPATTGPGAGETCGENDACAAPLECVSYYGIAGARGPQFKSCETRCKSDESCAAGQRCVTIADGPGQVCRVQ